jgi:hypothetical protein
VRGWAIDPRTADPVRVQVRRNGELVHDAYADGHRGDLGDLARRYGVAHGFDTEIPAVAGTNRVCVRIVAIRPGEDRGLGCSDVVHAVDPVGALEQVRAEGLGVTLSGWALDPNSPDPVTIVVRVDGERPLVGSTARASEQRPDVAVRHPRHGPRHGFDHFVAVEPGRREVCVTVVNVGLGRDRSLGCRAVDVEPGAGHPVAGLASGVDQLVGVVGDVVAAPTHVVGGVADALLGR